MKCIDMNMSRIELRSLSRAKLLNNVIWRPKTEKSIFEKKLSADLSSVQWNVTRHNASGQIKIYRPSMNSNYSSERFRLEQRLKFQKLLESENSKNGDQEMNCLQAVWRVHGLCMQDNCFQNSTRPIIAAA